MHTVITTAAAAWAALATVLSACIAVDFWVHRTNRTVSFSRAALWTVAWAAIAAAFGVFIGVGLGVDAAGQFAALYLTEWSLSIDNMLVLVVLIATLAVPPHMRHRVLLVGAVGAIALRLILIVAGLALLERFQWLMYVLGVMLLIVAVRLLSKRRDAGTEAPPLQRTMRRVAVGSPLMGALVLAVIADIIFALDSIPVAFALSVDPFLVFGANAFAVLGLRSMYFVVEGAMQRFRHLRTTLGILLVFVSLKMTFAWIIEVPVGISLAVIVTILGASVLASWLGAGRDLTRLRRDSQEQLPRSVAIAPSLVEDSA